MIYKDFQGLKISALGFGAMRLPQKSDNWSDVDEESAIALIRYAKEHGINYFDTAWGYHGNASETILGKALSVYPRDSYYLATKFPGYDISNMDKAEQIFEAQLKNCNVDYFDFYFLYNVCEMNIDEYLDEKHGILAYLTEQKKRGRIKHLGFSSHGTAPVFNRFLEKYGEHMELCILQVNYVDWDFQNAKEKVAYMKERGIPVWVMEPLRGGTLTKLDAADEAKLKALRPDESIPAWAFRFLQGQDVTVVLSGMSTMEQLRANIATYETEKPLNKTETETLLHIANAMTEQTSTPCTLCRYCLPNCPKGLNVPHIVKVYNEYRFNKNGVIPPSAVMSLDKANMPTACDGCKSCEAACPQNIKISEIMAELSAKLK